MTRRTVLLIVMIGFNLRSIILGVAPVLPEIRRELHLSFFGAGALSAIPVLGLGAAAIPGALLVSRFGARRVVTAAILGLGLASILRTSPPLPYSLFFWTSILAVLIASAQPAIASLVRSWFRDHVQRMATIYAMSLGLGGLAGSTLTVYLLGFGGWRGTFLLWGVGAICAAVLWFRFAPGRADSHVREPHGLGRLMRQREVWHVAALFGGQSLVFYGGAAWIPFLLQGYSHGYLALVLFLFQIVSLPLTAILSLTNLPWTTSARWYIAGGLLMTVGSVGLLLDLTRLAWILAPVMGLGNAMVFVGANALPATLADEPSEVAAYTALTLTAGYALAFLGPILGGALLDTTGFVTAPFAVLAAAAVGTALLGAVFRPKRRTIVPLAGLE